MYVLDSTAVVVHVYSATAPPREEPLAKINPKASDIVLLYNGRNHHDCLVSTAPLEEDLDDEDETDDDSSDATVDLTRDEDDDDRPEDDPIEGVDDATDPMRRYFEKAVEPIRGSIARQGNRHQRRLKGRWPWDSMWYGALPVCFSDRIRAGIHLQIRRCSPL